MNEPSSIAHLCIDFYLVSTLMDKCSVAKNNEQLKPTELVSSLTACHNHMKNFFLLRWEWGYFCHRIYWVKSNHLWTQLYSMSVVHHTCWIQLTPDSSCIDTCCVFWNYTPTLKICLCLDISYRKLAKKYYIKLSNFKELVITQILAL